MDPDHPALNADGLLKNGNIINIIRVTACHTCFFIAPLSDTCLTQDVLMQSQVVKRGEK